MAVDGGMAGENFQIEVGFAHEPSIARRDI
jgi:hypothetical protein